MKIKEFTTFTLNENTFIQVFKDRKTSNSVYGFCIIKVQWAAINIAVTHLGYYNVSPRCMS